MVHRCVPVPMILFSTLRSTKPCIHSNRLRLRRQLISRNSSASSRRITIPPPVPVTPSCPEPTCPCAPTPEMPEGLEIDHEHSLNGTMAPYSQQVLILTGQRDWRSTTPIVVDDPGTLHGSNPLPYNNIMITNTSFQPQHSTGTGAATTASVLLFPSFRYIPKTPLDEVGLDAFVRGFLLPTTLHPAHDPLPASQKECMRRVPTLQHSFFPDMARIRHSPTILICGHGHRDQRCGIMGPLLQTEFRRVLRAKGFRVSGGEENGDGAFTDVAGWANVGLISHIGGHKYAGNVIIYLPPSMSSAGSREGGPVSLAGKGIWYGRVEPRHVEGIVQETVLGGRVISDHFRGGVGADGEILRL
ncbi:sucrose cleavage family protein [Histoplasma capsulatum H143]|uniref:Altered inheritance of mitochondria protein 32 n=1 Tax=Ajellomyces capsulatus (strain H143) TaxID=544712 RepID=C6HGV9_AJECH|nr:sucrose cleavage family protein [Histoplasma capsulatum H143]